MNDDQGDGNTSDELGDFDVGGIWSDPGDKGYKTMPAGPMVRDRFINAEPLGHDVHKQRTLEAFQRCWEQRVHVEALPIKKRKSDQTSVDIELYWPSGWNAISDAPLQPALCARSPPAACRLRLA
jgi:hypothetical protein